jgi:hypothetical protein
VQYLLDGKILALEYIAITITSALDRKQDSVDVIKREFDQTLPGVDVGAAAITGRIRRTNFHLNRNAEEVFNGFNTTGASFDVLAACMRQALPFR